MGSSRKNKVLRVKKELEVDLMDTVFGLILPDNFGPIQTNQTGGVCCHHPRIRGHFIPLRQPWNPHGGDFEDYDILTKETIKALKKVNDFDFKFIKIPRTYKDQVNEEAWRWIKITKTEKFSPLKSLIRKTCVLVYPNSD